MTTPDLSHLEALARAVQAADDRADGHQTALASDAFHAAASPSTILSLVDRVRQLEAGLREACDLAASLTDDEIRRMLEAHSGKVAWVAKRRDPDRIAELAKLAEGK
jgi:hypothetical protein